MKQHGGILPSLSIFIPEVPYICGFGTHIHVTDFVGFANRKNLIIYAPIPY